MIDPKPTLVVWRVGTNDSFRKIPLDRFRETVAKGIGEIRALGAEVVMMNPQSYPAEARSQASAPTWTPWPRSARAQGAPVLDRYGIMRWWLETGRFEPTAILSADGLPLRQVGSDGRQLLATFALRFDTLRRRIAGSEEERARLMAGISASCRRSEVSVVPSVARAAASADVALDGGSRSHAGGRTHLAIPIHDE